MFERYTQAARLAIVNAKAEAEQSGASSIQARHLLLGVLREDPRIANLILGGRDLEDLRGELRAPEERAVSETPDLPFSAEAKFALALGADEADSHGSGKITTTHLLAGILRRETKAAEALRTRGFDLDRCRAEYTPG